MKKARKNQKAEAAQNAAIPSGIGESFPSAVLPAAAIAIVVLLVFKGVAFNSFVNWGDDRLGIKLLASSPALYHSVSLFLHSLNCASLFLILARIFPGENRWCSWLALVLLWFGVHPLRVETVAWASDQPELWGILLALGLTYAYLWIKRANDNDTIRWDGLGLLLCLCSAMTLILKRGFPQPETMRRAPDAFVFGELLAKTILPVRLFPAYPFAYLSGILFTTAAALFSYRIVRRKTPGRAGIFVGYAVLAAMMVATLKLVAVWNDSETLWRYATRLPGGASAQMYLKLATGMVEHGNITEAEEALRLAVQENPNLPIVHNSLGLCLLMRGDPKGAKEEFEKAIRLFPDFTAALSNLAQALSETGALEEALTQVEKAVRLNPGDPQVRENQARILEQLNRYADSIEPWVVVVNGHPKDDKARNHLANALLKTGKSKEAASQFLQATQLAPANAEYRFNLAMVLKDLGQLDAARDQMKTATKLDSSFVEAQEELKKMK